MHRRPLLDSLDAHIARWPDDHVRADHVRQFVRNHPDCFERTCLEGHITGSAWIVSPDHDAVLLTHHRKLDRWLQLGGHSDGVADPLEVALREACEESGLPHFIVAPEADGPLDVDVHVIPARGDEPAHLHHDIRYLLIADPAEPLRISDESHDLKWVRWDAIAELTTETSIQRMAARARRLLSRS